MDQESVIRVLFWGQKSILAGCGNYSTSCGKFSCLLSIFSSAAFPSCFDLCLVARMADADLL